MAVWVLNFKLIRIGDHLSSFDAASIGRTGKGKNLQALINQELCTFGVAIPFTKPFTKPQCRI